MGRKVLKVFLWSVGVALAGAVLGAKHSYTTSWYLAFLDKPIFLLTGGALGFLIGMAAIKSEQHPKMTEKGKVG